MSYIEDIYLESVVTQKHLEAHTHTHSPFLAA